jgi:hypothetical protein
LRVVEVGGHWDENVFCDQDEAAVPKAAMSMHLVYITLSKEPSKACLSLEEAHHSSTISYMIFFIIFKTDLLFLEALLVR